MSKKVHIIEIGYQKFACDSITAATQAVAVLSKLRPVSLNTDASDSDRWFYEPTEKGRFHDGVELKLNQRYREPKAEPKSKALALPAPKRGSILCICEKSYVAPKENCPQCGRTFSESHNRTHDDKPITPNGIIPFKLNP
jgi:hypothetical protein